MFFDDFNRPNGNIGPNYWHTSDVNILSIVDGKACGDVQSFAGYIESIEADQILIEFNFVASSNEGFEAHAVGKFCNCLIHDDIFSK